MTPIALETWVKPGPFANGGDLVHRFSAAFLHAGLTPSIRFSMAEFSHGKISPIARVLKRYPELARFDHEQPTLGEPGRTQRLLGNEVGAPEAGAPVEVALLMEVMAGIPKRYPFWSMTVRITHPVFGQEAATWNRYRRPGVWVEDRWGRVRRGIGCGATTLTEADLTAPSLPSLAPSVEAVLNGCGGHTALLPVVLPGADPDREKANATIMEQAKARLQAGLKNMTLPHDLPMWDDRAPEQRITARLPVLANAVRHLGYQCRGSGMGIVEGHRRTASNIRSRLYIDFGTMRPTIYATWSTTWLGGGVSVNLPEYSFNQGVVRVLDETRWRRIVENWAAYAAECDGIVVPLVEGSAKPTPAWYEPAVGNWGFPGLHLPHPNGSRA